MKSRKITIVIMPTVIVIPRASMIPRIMFYFQPHLTATGSGQIS